jgi:NADH-quinone oxidoreductase subunit F
VFRAGEKFDIKSKDKRGEVVEQKLDLLDIPYDFDTLMKCGSMSGSSAIIVLDDSVDIIEVLGNLSDFYAHESCGQCTPCREGSLWMAKALKRMRSGQARKGDAGYLRHIAHNIQGRTVCAFGEACSWPVLSFVDKFRDDFEQRGAEDETRLAKRGAEATTR